MNRIGEPVDVANAALFMASDEANWITGTVLDVDGGKSASEASCQEVFLPIIVQL